MSTPAQVAPAKRQDRTHYLYIAVVVAVVLGVPVGFLFPDFAKDLAWLGDAFVALITMMIQPVIFCTLVLGVGSVRSAASVGKVGGLALGYFLTMSTIALAIGLVVGNVIHPGAGLEISEAVAKEGAAQAEGAGSTTEFVDRHHPGLAVLLSHVRGRAADPAGGVARRFRAPVHGTAGRADPRGHRLPRSAWSSGCSR